MLEKMPLLKLVYFQFFRLNMWHLSRKQLVKFLFWFWHRKNDTRLYPYTSSFLFHIKSTIIKASAHSFKQFTSRLLKSTFSLSMHIYNSDGRHAWFHLHGTSRPDRSASEATKYKMKNSLSTVGLEPSTFRFQVWCSTYWASRAWWMLYV